MVLMKNMVLGKDPKRKNNHCLMTLILQLPKNRVLNYYKLKVDKILPYGSMMTGD